MIKYLIAFILFASPCLAGMGIGVFPYPGPGVVVADEYTSVFFDDFNRADSATVGGSWTSETDTSSLLSITGDALVWNGSSTNTAGYVEKILGSNYYRYKVSFVIKLGSTTTSTSNSVIRVVNLLNDSGNSSYFGIKSNGSTTINSIITDITKEDFTTINTTTNFAFNANATYNVEIIVTTSTSATANDGTYEVKIDGNVIYSASGIDSYLRHFKKIRSGVTYLSSAQTNTITIDDLNVFEGD